MTCFVVVDSDNRNIQCCGVLRPYITKNISEQKVYFYDRVLGKQIYYQEDRPVKWEITDVTEVQNGYKAQKALTNFGGRIWTAWFTKDINVSDGPYKFSGLPGLIVKLEDDKGDYKFDLVKQMMISSKTNGASPQRRFSVGTFQSINGMSPVPIQKVASPCR